MSYDKKKIRILIVDDHALMRQGLKQILEIEDDIEVVGLAIDGEDALKKAIKLKPDVILMDINMPNMNGIQALRRIKDMGLDIKIIMLTIHDDREYLFETINIGAEGYVLKDAEASSLVKAIRDVYFGESYIHPSLASEFVREYKQRGKISLKKDKKNEKLTRREYEVITLIAEGLNNKEIAERLFISEKTVKNHVSNIFKKIGVNDRTQAAIYAFKHNIKKI
ncbi:two component transcriptional regulator, LuxR family [Caminicella sporogenes DSM 14501]|uniref:Stage 0 sporulation protein A homolog n=1 Tax=Caminicella sporogenes DSM 14501 TaxID=1121266 RepID=A0A1M6MFR6_9FIRM|nr:response regulator transcription factor [Caminicella sporogenes]RKD27571.1 DNA-binding response regulator [Caminicella sporogenes]SHJ82170.1 two component transcriptional regulator, LuxR family [Caminicella sporogenes DSM 14501]